MTTIQAVVLAIVEGLTEFIPVSSTGHLIMVSSLMGIGKDEFTQFFEIAVQLGAILAVVVLYWRKFLDFKHWSFYVKLFAGVIPALVFGYLFSDKIDELLINPTYTAIALLAGGFVLLFIDNMFRYPRIKNEKEISYFNSFVIGLFQCIAMIPGVSRSAATIIGGMQQKLTRSLAAEFSFFLAVPTMVAATGKDLWDWYKDKGMIASGDIKMLLLGNVIAFVVAILAIKFFISYLQKHGFRLFGWYRIIVGIIVLTLVFSGRL